MNKLLILALTSLTLLTSNAWAHNAVGDSSSTDHVVAEQAHAIQKGGNQFYGSMLISQPADHADAKNTSAQKGTNELYGIM